MDFWATWCAPCIQELPASNLLRQQFFGKDVVFLYVSVDENPIVWEEFLTSKGFTGGTHVISNGIRSEVCETYNVKGVPRYMIIDRNGVIIDSNAKRPSDPEIFNDLQNALK